LRVHRSQQEM
jgi:hypothetical protein